MGARSSTSHALHTSGATHLPGRPRLNRGAYEEPFRLGRHQNTLRLPQQKKQQPADKFVTQPGDAKQSTKRLRQEEPPREQSGPSASSSSSSSSSSSYAADTSMDVREPHRPKPARR